MNHLWVLRSCVIIPSRTPRPPDAGIIVCHNELAKVFRVSIDYHRARLEFSVYSLSVVHSYCIALLELVRESLFLLPIRGALIIESTPVGMENQPDASECIFFRIEDIFMFY